MLFKKVKDIGYRKLFFKEEHKIKLKKFIFINIISQSSVFKKRYKINKTNLYTAFYLGSFFKKNKKISKVKLSRRCLINNSSRTASYSFNLSRSLFRDLLQFGLVPGYKKAVW
jgi:ribosomal protein S14